MTLSKSNQQLSDADKKRLVELKNKNVNGVVDCKSARERYCRGNSVGFLAEDAGVTPKAVMRHLRGGCECEQGGPVVETSGVGGGSEKTCPRDECGVVEATYDDLTEHLRHDHGGDE